MIQVGNYIGQLISVFISTSIQWQSLDPCVEECRGRYGAHFRQNACANMNPVGAEQCCEIYIQSFFFTFLTFMGPCIVTIF